MRAMIETKNGRMRAMIHNDPHILNRPIARLLFGLTARLFLHLAAWLPRKKPLPCRKS
jgi:hypothetical protein